MPLWASIFQGLATGLLLEVMALGVRTRNNGFRLPFNEEQRPGYAVAVGCTVVSSGIAAGLASTLGSVWLVLAAALVTGGPIRIALHIILTIRREEDVADGAPEVNP